MPYNKSSKNILLIPVILFLISGFFLGKCTPSVNIKDPKVRESLFNNAMEYYNRSALNDYQRAIELFENCMSGTPEDALIYAMLSMSYSRIGQHYSLKAEYRKADYYYDKAFKYALYSIKLNPSLSKGYTALALHSRQFEKRNLLIQYAKKAIQLNPKDHEAYALLGDSNHPVFFKDQGDYEIGRRYYIKSLQIEKKYLPAIYNLGLLHFNYGKYSKAQKYFRKAISFNPKISAFYYYLSLCYFRLKKYDSAEIEIHQGIQLDPDNAYYYDLSGQIAFKRNDLKKAIQSFNRAVSINQNVAMFYYHLGMAFHKLKKYITSIKLYTKASQLDPKYDLPHYRMGQIYQKLKKYKLALKEYLICIDLTNSEIIWERVYKKIQGLKKILGIKKDLV